MPDVNEPHQHAVVPDLRHRLWAHRTMDRDVLANDGVATYTTVTLLALIVVVLWRITDDGASVDLNIATKCCPTAKVNTGADPAAITDLDLILDHG